MKLSAVCENTDHAECAARRVKEAGIRVLRRRITPLGRRGAPGKKSPVLFAGTGITGFAVPVAALFLPAGGEAEACTEVRLELEVEENAQDPARDALIGAHAAHVRRYR